jgi:hypothetical protein
VTEDIRDNAQKIDIARGPCDTIELHGHEAAAAVQVNILGEEGVNLREKGSPRLWRLLNLSHRATARL